MTIVQANDMGYADGEFDGFTGDTYNTAVGSRGLTSLALHWYRMGYMQGYSDGLDSQATVKAQRMMQRALNTGD